MTATQLLVLAKAPVPCRVKTRLCPPYRPAEAAELAGAALADTLAAVAATPARRRILVLDGELNTEPPGFTVVPQAAGGLAARIACALSETAAPGTASVLIGMDTPQVTPRQLGDLAQRLSEPGVDAVLGPCADGGWWCLGLRDARLGRLVAGVPMSTPETGERTHAALRNHGLTVVSAPLLRDVDTAADATQVAAEAPTTRFAAAHAALAVDARTSAAPSVPLALLSARSRLRPGRADDGDALDP